MFQKRSNRRVKRAQQLKQQRAAGSPTSKKQQPEEGGVDLEMGPLCSLLCAVLIVALGATMALAVFMYTKPDCMKELGLDRQSLLLRGSSSKRS